MNLPLWAQRLSHVLLVLTVPVVLLFSPLHLFVTNSFVRYEYALPDLPPAERFDDEERLRLSGVLVGYLRGTSSLQDMVSLRTSDGQQAMREREIEHMQDVKMVMDGIFVAHAVAAVVLLLSLVLLAIAGQRSRLSLALRQGVGLMAVLIVAILLSALLDFDVFFTRLHQVFFSAGSWVFYVEDTLIQLYPLCFWVDAVWKIGAVVLVEVAVVYAVASVLGRGAQGLGAGS